MVDIDAVLLCANAEWTDEERTLVNLIGAGANAVQTDDPFPWPLRAYCGLVVSADGTDFERAVNFQIEIVDLDGETLGIVNINWMIQRPLNYVPGLRFRQSFPADLSGFTVPRKGMYSLNLSIDGTVRKQLPFLVY